MEKTVPPKSPPGTAGNRQINARRAEKKARRRAAQAAARKQAVARKWRQALGGFAAVVVVVLAVVAVIKLAGGSSPKTAALSSTASPSASSPPVAEPSATPTATPFPPVPAGANAALKTKPVVRAGTGTLSKLTVKTLVKGAGAAVKTGDSVTVNYVGVTYPDGKEFDSSWSRSQAFTFTIGEGGVIAGWDQGLLGIPVGSRVQLDIPTALAYPNATNGQPSGPLRFVVDVLAAQPGT